MRQISINTICTLSVTAAVVAVITVLVVYVSTSSYHMVAGVQTEALNETSKIVARSAEIYIQQSVDVATILSRQEPVLKAFSGQPQDTGLSCFLISKGALLPGSILIWAT